MSEGFVMDKPTGLRSFDIMGVWQDEHGEFKVRIEPNGPYYIGKIVWLKHGLDTKGNPKKDELNPDPALRHRTYIGLPVITGLTFDGERWTGGKLYDVESGRTYDCYVSLITMNRAEVRAFIGFPFLGRSLFFDRVFQ
ncbi:MAG: DUF2147 domain-containing protein [Flavobacteriales bacterium]|nr:DUF2147 domain-containing protein [Flavobacteriales bacterium]MCX7768733.1 DUF2147 domain-containing protein [Flavobacteriales bacterium]MDW8409893.1 DUF2147 domain-containing protein [Flavobacteriales bacterium]